jgi:hypothetical protein
MITDGLQFNHVGFEIPTEMFIDEEWCLLGCYAVWLL